MCNDVVGLSVPREFGFGCPLTTEDIDVVNLISTAASTTLTSTKNQQWNFPVLATPLKRRGHSAVIGKKQDENNIGAGKLFESQRKQT